MSFVQTAGRREESFLGERDMFEEERRKIVIPLASRSEAGWIAAIDVLAVSGAPVRYLDGHNSNWETPAVASHL